MKFALALSLLLALPASAQSFKLNASELQPVAYSSQQYATASAARNVLDGGTTGGELHRTISWDEWHYRLSGPIAARFLPILKAYGNPHGSCRLKLFIWPNRKIVATIARTSGNEAFDQAMLELYNGLTGIPELDYPQGSKRGPFTYCVSASNFGGLYHKDILYGDLEHQTMRY